MNDEMNTQLLSIYECALDEFYPAIPPTQEVSRPLLLSVPDGYHRAEIKLMVVGQQTKGWGDGYTSASDLMQFYREFDLARTYYGRGAPFWRAAHELHTGLNPHGPERAFLWSNLVKVDQQGTRPTPDVEEVVSGLGLLPREIAITRPDAVVFLIGPDYKERLCKTFPNVERQPIPPVLTKLAHPKLPRQTYQTYHPKYLSLSKQWNTIDKIISLIRGELQCDNNGGSTTPLLREE